MPSANTVAQKPAGNFSPLSSLGQDGVLVSLPELDSLRAGAIGSIRHNTATKDSRVLFMWSRRPESDFDGRMHSLLPLLAIAATCEPPSPHRSPHRELGRGSRSRYGSIPTQAIWNDDGSRPDPNPIRFRSRKSTTTTGSSTRK